MLVGDVPWKWVAIEYYSPCFLGRCICEAKILICHCLTGQWVEHKIFIAPSRRLGWPRSPLCHHRGCRALPPGMRTLTWPWSRGRPPRSMPMPPPAPHRRARKWWTLIRTETAHPWRSSMAWRTRPRPQRSVHCRGRRSTTITSSSTSGRRRTALRRRSCSSRPRATSQALSRGRGDGANQSREDTVVSRVLQ